MRLTLTLLGAAWSLLAFVAEIRAQPVDLLVTGGIVVTMNADREVFENGEVAVRDGRIVAVGPARSADLPGLEAVEVIDASGRIVLPGLVNAHTHVPMVLFRGMADDLTLEDWLNNHIFPAESANVSREFVAAGTRLALAEMIRGGTTTFSDMYYFEDAIAEETSRAGMRGVLGQTVLDFPAPDMKTWPAALENAERFVRDWRDDPLIVPAIAPHASYTVSTEHLSEVKALAESLDVPILMHVAESPGEVDYTIEHYDTTPVSYLDEIGLLSERLIGAHVVQVDDREIQLLKEYGVGIGHCPQSNMKIAVGVAPVPKMISSGLRVGLGTDGAASNNDLNMWEEMDTAAKLHKVIAEDPTVVSAREALAMGTIGGARALHLENEIGSLEAGKLADLIIVDAGSMHMVPMYDVYSHLVYAAKASDVTHTVVAGRVLMRDGELETLDEAAILEEAKRYGRLIADSLRDR